MKNLSKLSLKKALTREELKEVRGEGHSCYCYNLQSPGPGFYYGGWICSGIPSHYICSNN